MSRLVQDDARVRLVLEQIRQKHRDAGAMRALGFCVSIAHAEFMARRFTAGGLPSVAVSAETDTDMRKAALASLRTGRVRALFAVDLFNEGVDLPGRRLKHDWPVALSFRCHGQAAG